MKIQRISLKNFKCFPNVKLPASEGEEFPDGLIIIQGNTRERSNSFGKSSLVEALLVALFGHEASDLTYDDMITFGEREAEIKLNLILDGNEYLIIRTLKRNKGASAKFFIKHGDRFQEDPNINIPELLQIRWKQAKGTVFVKQGEIENLVKAKPAQLRDLIIQLFRLDISDATHANLDAIKKKAEAEFKKLQKTYRDPDEIVGDIEEEKRQLNEEKKKLADIEQELGELKDRLQTYPKIDQITNLNTLSLSIRDKSSKMRVYQQDIEGILNQFGIDDTAIASKVNELNSKILKLKEEIQKLNEEKQSLLNAQTAITTQIKVINGNLKKIQDSIKFEAGNEIAKCPTCQRDITTTDVEEIRFHFQTEINDLMKKKPEIDLNAYNTTEQENQIKELNVNISKIQSVNEKINKRKKFEEEIGLIQTEIEQNLKTFDVKTIHELLVKFQVKDIGGLKAIVKSIQTNITNKEQNLLESKERRNKFEGKIKALKAKMEEMKARRQQLDDLETRSNHAELGKKLVKSFVTEYMVEKRLIKNINIVTSEFIKYFTGGQYDTLSLTSGGRQGTSLFIQVHDIYNNKQKENKFLSGGDKAAIGFALRFGISDLMRKIRPTKTSPKQNPRVDFLILDEPLGTLDTMRREIILETLQSQDKFNQIFLITHTAIPEDIIAHFIRISKNIDTGLSSAKLIINPILI